MQDCCQDTRHHAPLLCCRKAQPVMAPDPRTGQLSTAPSQAWGPIQSADACNYPLPWTMSTLPRENKPDESLQTPNRPHHRRHSLAVRSGTVPLVPLSDPIPYFTIVSDEGRLSKPFVLFRIVEFCLKMC